MVAAIALIGIATVIAYWLIFRPNPDRDATHLAASISNQSWEDVYDQATNLEKSQEPWTRNQFAKLMDRITTGEPKSLGSPVVAGNWRGQTTNEAFTFQFPNLKDPSDPKRMAMVGSTFFREGSRYAPMLMHIVTQMNNLAGGTESEQDERLIEAMDLARISSITDYAFHIQLTLEHLKQVHEGKIPRAMMFSPVPVR